MSSMPTTSGRMPGSTATAERLADRGVELVRQVETQERRRPRPRRRSTTSSAPPTRLPLIAEREQDGRHRDRHEQQDAVEHAPAHRAEQPLPEPQRRPDDEQEDREDDEADGERAERRDPPDLAGDRAGLGLGEVDVGQGERDGGIADRTDLVAQAGRRPTRTARRRPGGRRPGRRRSAGGGSPGGGVEGSGVAFGSSRGVLQVGSCAGSRVR